MSRERKGELVVMFYPVKDRCNLRCRYCFYLDGGHRGHSPVVEVFRSTIERVAVHYHQIKLFWCGGEFMLAGKRYFREVARITRGFAERGVVIRHVGQTNATLIDFTWIEIFCDLNFEVGLSLDLPLELNDRYRCWPNGRSATEILRGVDMIVNSGLKYKMTATVTRKALGREEEIAQELQRRFPGNVRQAFSPCYMGPDSARDMFVTGAEYAEFIRKITPLVPWRVREADFAKLRDLCLVRSECEEILFVDYAGRWYTCSRIFDQEKLLFEGNLKEYQEAKKRNFIGKHDCACLDERTRTFWREFLENFVD